MNAPLRVGIAGIHGHGRSHVDAALRLAATGDIELAAAADPTPGGELPPHTRRFADAIEMMDAAPLDIVILSTPIPTHESLTAHALSAGIHVLLEKPPVPSITAHRSLVRMIQETQRSVQVGFQSLGSAGVAATADVAASGSIGDVLHFGAVGLWSRSEEYWRRSDWAGRKTMNGRLVADGVVTNPLAHALATSLVVAGARAPEDVLSVELDLYAANDIEADDTSSLRIRTATGASICAALAVTSPRRSEPYVLVRGTRGHAVFHYTLDTLTVTTDASPLARTYAFRRTPLLDDLVAHVRTGTPLAVPLEATGAFTTVLDAVVAAEPPHRIDPVHIISERRGDETFRVVDGIEGWAERVAWDGRTFRDAGAPWT